jgi:hypothetical protein
MITRAKFQVTEKSENIAGFAVVLHAVTGVSEANTTFFKYAPSGTIRMSVLNEWAADAFEVGREYDVHFTPASEK